MPEEKPTWLKKDVWKRQGKDFLVEVSRHTEPPSSINHWDGENRWCVYAYIYPKHRLFDRFDGESMLQDAACCLPLHRGPSYLRAHRGSDGQICSYQVGADYHHHGDDRFTHYDSDKDAYQVFVDADALFEHLSPLHQESP